MKQIAILGLAVALTACTTPVEPAPPEEPVGRLPGEDSPCNAAPAQRFVGQKASQAVGQQIIEATGSQIFQWVPPDTAVTMDYRPDRVRVSYDRAMTITVVRCG